MSTTTEIKTISLCKEGENCPYLNGGSIFQILAERDYWQETAEKRERTMALAEKEILKLREGNRLLKEEKQSLQQELNQAHQKPKKTRTERGRRQTCQEERCTGWSSGKREKKTRKD